MLVCREETCRLVGETPSVPTNRLNEHRCKMLGHWTRADRPRTSIRSGAALANARSGQRANTYVDGMAIAIGSRLRG
jgi:hypothetical protein